MLLGNRWRWHIAVMATMWETEDRRITVDHGGSRRIMEDQDHGGSENAKDTTCYDLLWTRPVSLQKHNQSDCESRRIKSKEKILFICILAIFDKQHIHNQYDTDKFWHYSLFCEHKSHTNIQFEYLPSHQYIGCQLPDYAYTVQYATVCSKSRLIQSHPIPSVFVCFLVLSLVKIHARGRGTGNGKELRISLEEWIKVD